MSRLPKKAVVALTEEQINQTIRDGLSALGYNVFSTTVRGWRGQKGYGASKGVPDLLIGRNEWGPVLMPLEVKGPKTPLSLEQADLLEKGLIYVARSWEAAIEAVAGFEEQFGFRQVARRAS